MADAALNRFAARRGTRHTEKRRPQIAASRERESSGQHCIPVARVLRRGAFSHFSA
jgi:hypothetical protein